MLAAQSMRWMTTFVLLAIGWLPIPELPVQQQRPDRQQLIAELRTMGSVHVNETQPGQPVVRVSLSGPRVTDDVIDTVTQFTELRELSLSDTRVTGIGLRALSRINGPKLSLSGLWVTDEIMKSVGELTKLRELHLIDTRVTDAGIRRRHVREGPRVPIRRNGPPHFPPFSSHHQSRGSALLLRPYPVERITLVQFPILHHIADLARVLNVLERISRQHDQVGQFARLDAPQVLA